MAETDEEFEAAKRRLQLELHRFLAEVLATNANQVDAFASAVKKSIESQGVNKLRLAEHIETQINRIESTLQTLRTSQGPALEQQFAEFGSQLDARLKSVAAMAQDSQNLSIKLVGHRRERRPSNEGELFEEREIEALNIKLHMPRPDWRAWLPAILAGVAAVTCLLAVTVFQRPDGASTGGEPKQAANQAAATPRDGAAQRGWEILQDEVRNPANPLSAAQMTALCGSSDGCGDLQTMLERWRNDAEIPPALAKEVQSRAPVLCPQAADDGLRDDQISGLLACLRIAGNAPVR